ncbi:hypothetical protein MK489_14345 [Myxococcota bacterium]|nr:hypothetical protein [Myxococcota bacterium]
MTREYLEGSHGLQSDYHTYLEERFQGEVYGEALFGAMAEGCDDPVRVRKLRLLEQLERETKEFLLPLVMEAGHSGEASQERIAEGIHLGRQLAKVPWGELLQGFQSELERFVLEFEQAEGLAPPGKRNLLRRVTDHERALLDFSTREIEGDEPGALGAVVSILTEPPVV